MTADPVPSGTPDPATDEQPTPEEVLNEQRWIRVPCVDEDGNTDCSLRQPNGSERLAALSAAGYRVVPEPDDDTRREVEALVPLLFTESKWIESIEREDAPDVAADIERAAELLAAAFLGRSDTPEPEPTPERCPNGCGDGLITVGDGDYEGAASHEEHCPHPWHDSEVSRG